MSDQNHQPEHDIETPKESGDIVECAGCGELSDYAWQFFFSASLGELERDRVLP